MLTLHYRVKHYVRPMSGNYALFRFPPDRCSGTVLAPFRVHARRAGQGAEIEAFQIYIMCMTCVAQAGRGRCGSICPRPDSAGHIKVVREGILEVLSASPIDLHLLKTFGAIGRAVCRSRCGRIVLGGNWGLREQTVRKLRTSCVCCSKHS